VEGAGSCFSVCRVVRRDPGLVRRRTVWQDRKTPWARAYSSNTPSSKLSIVLQGSGVKLVLLFALPIMWYCPPRLPHIYVEYSWILQCVNLVSEHPPRFPGMNGNISSSTTHCIRRRSLMDQEPHRKTPVLVATEIDLTLSTR